MKTIKKKIIVLFYIFIILCAFASIFFICYSKKDTSFNDFLSSIENRTFDLRQNIIAQNKKTNKNIVIIDVDSVSYEYIVDKYGDWPPTRDLWGNLIKDLNKYQPKLIVFDLLFPKHFKKSISGDFLFINQVNSNKNVLTAMDFDNYPNEIRPAPKLPQGLKNSISNDSIIKTNPTLNFTNCRTIMQEILNNNSNIGFVNSTRDKDGITRYVPLFFVYQDSYYKHLTLLAALKVLGIEKNNFELKNNNLILDKTHKIPLDSSGRAILNWYGGSKTFEHIALWKVEQAIQNNDKQFLNNFRDKIIYVATSATALSDVKSSPVSIRIAGVEIHATLLNNILNNEFISHVANIYNIIITLLLSALISLFVFKTRQVIISFIESISLLILYFIINICLMNYCNLWVDIVIPTIMGILTLVLSYMAKYLLISRDYEHTYKLSITDVLTGLYNHRYFQEQMIIQSHNYQRYKTPSSLIMIDIDFFKKFNDTYGHQSGDAVLRQVAQAIKKCVRQTDIVCRYGGEEMSVILTNTNNEEAKITAEKICKTVAQKEVELVNGDMTHVTISLGVATMNEKVNTPEATIKVCDDCLYKAKENGRNQVVNMN